VLRQGTRDKAEVDPLGYWLHFVLPAGRDKMEPVPNEFNLFWVEPDRASNSPENMEAAVPLTWDLSHFSEAQAGRGFGAPLRHHHQPLPSPTNHLSNGPPLFPPVLHPFPGPLMMPTLSASSSKTRFQGMPRRLPPLSQNSFFFEESTSTDATPESSDVEDENRAKKKKRVKQLLSDEQTVKHQEEADKFPLFLNELRGRLLSENNDGRIQDTAAISALIQEFTKSEGDSGFTMPLQCEIWLKQAAEHVQATRQMRKGNRKKKLLESVKVAGSAGNERFNCPHCPEDDAKIFKTQEGLNLHIRNKHEADKQWKCLAPQCTVSFVRQADLRMHLIRMHSPQRPFPCKVPFCLKAFAGVSELRRHVKVDHRSVVQQLTGNGTSNNVL